MNERTRAQQVLRQWAEMVANENVASLSPDRETLSPEAVRQQLHELRVRQIELEMQNEELQRARDELTAMHARYFDLYDLAPVGYFRVSEHGLILEANLTAATMLGVSRRDLITQPIARFIVRDDADSYYLHHNLIIKTGTPQTCELRMVTHDGTPFWVYLQSTAAQGEDGAPVHHIVTSDITARKQAEGQLRAFLEHSEVVAWMKDDTGRYVFLNERYEKRFGLRVSDWAGKTDAELWPRESAEELRRRDLAVLAHGYAMRFVGQVRGFDGSVAWWLDQRFLYQDGHGKRYLCGLSVDITDCHDAVARPPIEAQSRDSQKIEASGTLSGDGARDVTSHIAAASEKEGATVPPATDRPRTPRSNTEDSSNSTVRQLTARIRFLERRTADLEKTLEDRKLIEKAKGLLMERLKVSEAEAMRKLQHESQHRNIKLAEMSRIILQASEILSMDK